MRLAQVFLSSLLFFVIVIECSLTFEFRSLVIALLILLFSERSLVFILFLDDYLIISKVLLLFVFVKLDLSFVFGIDFFFSFFVAFFFFFFFRGFFRGFFLLLLPDCFLCQLFHLHELLFVVNETSQRFLYQRVGGLVSLDFTDEFVLDRGEIIDRSLVLHNLFHTGKFVLFKEPLAALLSVHEIALILRDSEASLFGFSLNSLEDVRAAENICEEVHVLWRW